VFFDACGEVVRAAGVERAVGAFQDIYVPHLGSTSFVPRAGIEPARDDRSRGILHVLPKFPYGVDYIFPPEADRALFEGLLLGLTF